MCKRSGIRLHISKETTRYLAKPQFACHLAEAGQGTFLPRTRQELQVLLDIYLLEKAIYELGYELNNRPDWVKIPLRGIQQLLQTKD